MNQEKRACWFPAQMDALGLQCPCSVPMNSSQTVKLFTYSVKEHEAGFIGSTERRDSGENLTARQATVAVEISNLGKKGSCSFSRAPTHLCLRLMEQDFITSAVIKPASWSYLQRRPLTHFLLGCESRSGTTADLSSHSTKDSWKQSNLSICFLVFPTDSSGSSVFLDAMAHLDSDSSSERYSLVQDGTQLGQTTTAAGYDSMSLMEWCKRTRGLMFFPLFQSRVLESWTSKFCAASVAAAVLGSLVDVCCDIVGFLSACHQLLKHKRPVHMDQNVRLCWWSWGLFGNEIFFSLCTRPLKPLGKSCFSSHLNILTMNNCEWFLVQTLKKYSVAADLYSDVTRERWKLCGRIPREHRAFRHPNSPHSTFSAHALSSVWVSSYPHMFSPLDRSDLMITSPKRSVSRQKSLHKASIYSRAVWKAWKPSREPKERVIDQPEGR